LGFCINGWCGVGGVASSAFTVRIKSASFFGSDFFALIGEQTMFEYRVKVITKNGVASTFRFGGGPIEQPTEAHQPLFFALGLLAANWARFEQHIDAILIHINKKRHSPEVKALYDPDHPVSFSRKLQLLKKYFNQHPALSPLKASMRELSPRFKKLSKLRNKFLHAIVEDYDAEKHVIDFNTVQFKGNDTFHAEQWKTNVVALMGLAGNVARGNRALYEISSQVFTIEALKQLGRAGQPIRRRTTRPDRGRGG
jgi:hypothetical protein